MTDLGAWLDKLGLQRYAAAFRDSEITAEVLPELTDGDLRELGLPLGPRKLLLKAIASLPGPAAEPVPPPTDASREAERRQLTVFFCDLVGSTALATSLDPEDLGQVMGAYRDAVAAEVDRFDGYVAQFLGDGVVAYFGWPEAHEDDAERAVRAGLAAVEAVRTIDAHGLAMGRGREERVRLAARVGIATGLVVVGELIGRDARRQRAVVGETPNLAARLQGLAAPGQVVIGDATRRLVGAGFELGDLGRHELKGLAEPVEAFAVLDERLVASRFEARTGAAPPPMVGRDQELALLLERWARATAGEGQGVLLVGEAGIGKSRLTRALLDAVADLPHTRIRYQCSPHHVDSALWPVIQQLIRAAGIADSDPDDAKLDALETLLARPGNLAAAPLIADLLGLDGEARHGRLDLTPQMRRTRTLAALIDHMLGLAARSPLLVVLEDAHWIDPTTLELLDQGLERIAGAPVLVLLTSRPERQPQLVAHPHVTRLGLDRLGRAGIEAIVARLWGQAPPADVTEKIVLRTDGVPLFVEELTKAILEGGEAAIPASLHDSLMARLDRLASVREIAQIGAVIGREFGHDLLADVADRPTPELSAGLERLVASELVFRRGTPPEATYSFKHALVQDAAYQSLLKSRRQQLHARIARALEARFAGVVKAHPELIAHHLTAAGETERAIDWWQRAGDQARLRFANPEAVVHYRRALELLAGRPSSQERDRQELQLRLDLGGPLFIVEGYTSARVRQNGLRTVELCRSTGEDRSLFRALYDLQRNAFQSADFDRASVYARELVALGERTGDRHAEICGVFGLASIDLVRGQLPAARELFERGEALDDLLQQSDLPAQHFQPGIGCRAFGAMNLWMLGHPEQASRHMAAAMAGADRVGTPFIVGFALHRKAVLHHYRRDPPAALATADRFLELADAHPMDHWVPWLLFIRAWGRAARGDHDAALADLAEAWPLWFARGSETYGPYFRCVAAEVHLAVGEADAGLKVLADALDVSQRTGERHWLPEVQRIGGRLLLARNASLSDEAAGRFEAALEEARCQQATLLELRAAADLARLWAEQGERRKACDLLAPVYDRFTEGFDTADLEEARALLDELG